MKHTITTIYYLCDTLLKAMNYQDDPQASMTTAEVMTVALTAAACCDGHLERSRELLHEHGYMPRMLSKSRLNRRLHAIPAPLWQTLFGLLSAAFKATNTGQEYVVDSFPVPVCDNIRIGRCRLYQDEAFRGKIASKKRYFYGLRVHMVITASGEPVEFLLVPGSTNDNLAFKFFDLELPQGATLYGDKEYNDYSYEDLLREAAQIELKPLRKKNSKRPFAAWIEYVQQRVRKRIETSFSQITRLFPKQIHAVTARGFELKLIWFILAFAIQLL